MNKMMLLLLTMTLTCRAMEDNNVGKSVVQKIVVRHGGKPREVVVSTPSKLTDSEIKTVKGSALLILQNVPEGLPFDMLSEGGNALSN
jgi:hypothetical protein